jgi:uncharacterized membrane protein (DUF4010 family)
MVVLIVGINLSGYIVYKFLGEKTGLVMGGVLGGLISSTATTVSYSRRTANDSDSVRSAAIIIAVASAIVFGRVILEIATVAPSFLPVAVQPLLVMMLAMAISAFVMWFWGRGQAEAMPPQENPTELKSALLFSLLYAVLLLAIEFAQERYGGRGLYFVAGLSGLTDVDAITLSTSRMVMLDRISADQGWRLIVLATMSNLIFKALIVAALGHRQLLGRISGCFGLALVVGLFLLLR